MTATKTDIELSRWHISCTNWDEPVTMDEANSVMELLKSWVGAQFVGYGWDAERGVSGVMLVDARHCGEFLEARLQDAIRGAMELRSGKDRGAHTSIGRLLL